MYTLLFSLKMLMPAIILIFIYMNIVYIISLIKKDNSIVDIAYGIGYIILTWSYFIIINYLTINIPFHDRLIAYIVNILTTIWGLRLSTRIYFRNKGKEEDFRYKAWRMNWKWFKLRSFFQIYMLQGFIIILMSSANIYANLNIYKLSINPILFFLGIFIWILGFFYEYIGDKELDNFINDKSENKPRLLKTGLWSKTRHPNYFGEVTLWYGITLIVLSSIKSYIFLPYICITAFLIHFLILKVSGIPMLEKKYEGDIDYEEYKKEVPAFWPKF